MKTIYRLTKELLDGRIVYGIEAVKKLNDIFCSEEEGIEFVNRCNRLAVSDVHFFDVIQDYLQYR